MSEYFVGTTGTNNQTTFESLTTSEVLDDLQLNTTHSPTFNGLTVGNHVLPNADSTIDLGTNSTRFANVYADTLYGDGSNLTNLPSGADNTKLPLAGGTMSGAIAMGSQNITGGGSFFANLFSVGNEGKVVSTSTSGLQLQSTGSQKPIIFSTNDGGMTERMRVHTDGNVGIGTGATAPADKLTIQEDSADFSIRKTDGTLSARIVQFGSGASELRQYDASGSQKVSINTVGDSYFNGGNVGIGATIPSSLLHINAADGVMVDTYTAYIRNQEATAGDNFGLGIQAGSNSSDVSLQVSDKAGTSLLRVRGDGNVGIGTTSPARKLHVSTGNTDVAARFENTTSNGNVIEVKTSGDNKTLNIQTDHIYSNTALHLGSDSYNTYIRGSNVGIGTTSPESLLNVVASGNGSTALTVEDDARKIKIGRDSIQVTDTSDTNTTLYLNGGGGNVSVPASSFTVGSTGPDSGVKLQVTGHSKFKGDSYHSHFNYGTDQHTYIRGGKAGAEVYINDIGNSDVGIAAGGGNVGIGTNSPDFKLDVAGDIGIDDKIYHNGDHNTYISLTSDTQTFRTGGTDRVTINNTGVGIGTTSPSAKLELKGSTTDSTANTFVARDSASASLFSIRNDGRVDATGDLVVGGNLTVNGTTTTINSTTLQVDDKNIELGTVATPTDTTADGGGITLKGATDKTINWVNSTGAWTFSEKVSVPADGSVFGGSGGVPIYVRSTGTVSYIQIQNSSTGGSGSNDGLTVGCNGNAGYLWLREAANLNIGTNDTTAITISSSQNTTFAGKITSGNDIVNATAGVYTWVGDTDTYIQRSAGNEITIKTGASNALVLDSSQNATFAGSVTATGLDINGAADISGNLEVGEYILRSGQGSNYHRFLASRQIFVVGNASSIDLNNGTSTFGATGGATTLQGSSLLLDSADAIVLDADDDGSVKFKDAGTEFGRIYNAGSNFYIKSIVSDKDLVFVGNDGGTAVEALRLDMSNGGNATFAGTVTATSLIKSGGTSSEFLKADGSVDSSAYLTSLGTAIVDGDFTANGLMKRTGAGTYTSITDNSSNWNTAYTHTSATNNPHSVTATQVGLGNVTNESKATMFTSPSFTGDVIITDDTFPFIKSSTNGAGAGIKFSDQTGTYAQQGTLTFLHTNTVSYGSGAAFILGTSETTSTILADGKLMYGEGIYSKPATGTGAGTRKDSNWDTAYTHTSATNNPHSVTASQVGAYTSGATDTLLAAKAPLASPALTGNPTAPTQSSSENSTKIATTAYVKSQGYITSANGGNAGTLDGYDSTQFLRSDANDTMSGTLTFSGASSHIALQQDHVVFKRFDVTVDEGVTNSTTAYLLLCRNAPYNDVNGTVTMDRTSGLRHACSVDIVVSAGTGTNPAGTCRSIGTAGGSSPSYELVTLTYSSNSFIALKITNPDAYYETSGHYFTGRLATTDTTNAMQMIAPASVSSVSDFDSNPSHQINGNSVFHDGYHPNADTLTTARTISLGTDLSGSASFNGGSDITINAQIAANAVGSSEIVANAVGTSEIADGAVTAIKLATNSVTATKIAGSAVGASELNVVGNGSTSQFLRSDGDGTFTWATPTDTNTVYTHPTHAGDDINIDTGALTGATVISDLDFNVTTDGLGHVTDANGTVSTRTLTAANLGISAPNAPASASVAIVGETVEVTFAASTTSNIDAYLVYSSIDGSDYGLISVVPPDDFAASMSIIDNAFDETGTQAYRVYAMKYGILSSAATASVSYAVSSAEPTSMSVVNLNNAYYVQWNPPSSNARFVTAYNVYKHEHATQGSLSRSSASLVYSGMNTNYMYQISGTNNNNFHQFWVETTIA